MSDVKAHVKITLVRGDGQVGSGQVFDEYEAYYDLDGPDKQAKQALPRLRKVMRRELIRLGLLVPSNEDRTR